MISTSEPSRSKRERTLAAIDALHRAKHEAYGDAWKRRGEVLGILANEARKVDRLEAWLAGHQGVAGETELDTAVDLLVYALKHVTWLLEQDSPTSRESFYEGVVQEGLSDDPRHITRLLQTLGSWGGADVKGMAQEVVVTFEELERCYTKLDAENSPLQRYHIVNRLATRTWQLVGGLIQVNPDLLLSLEDQVES